LKGWKDSHGAAGCHAPPEKRKSLILIAMRVRIPYLTEFLRSTGVPMKDLCRRIGISGATFYHWKAKYGGMEVSETRRLRQMEEENGRLKRIVAQQALDLDALKVVLAKKW